MCAFRFAGGLTCYRRQERTTMRNPKAVRTDEMPSYWVVDRYLSDTGTNTSSQIQLLAWQGRREERSITTAFAVKVN